MKRAVSLIVTVSLFACASVNAEARGVRTRRVLPRRTLRASEKSWEWGPDSFLAKYLRDEVTGGGQPKVPRAPREPAPPPAPPPPAEPAGPGFEEQNKGYISDGALAHVAARWRKRGVLWLYREVRSPFYQRAVEDTVVVYNSTAEAIAMLAANADAEALAMTAEGLPRAHVAELPGLIEDLIGLLGQHKGGPVERVVLLTRPQRTAWLDVHRAEAELNLPAAEVDHRPRRRLRAIEAVLGDNALSERMRKQYSLTHLAELGQVFLQVVDQGLGAVTQEVNGSRMEELELEEAGRLFADDDDTLLLFGESARELLDAYEFAESDGKVKPSPARRDRVRVLSTRTATWQTLFASKKRLHGQPVGASLRDMVADFWGEKDAPFAHLILLPHPAPRWFDLRKGEQQLRNMKAKVRYRNPGAQAVRVFSDMVTVQHAADAMRDWSPHDAPLEVSAIMRWVYGLYWKLQRER